MIKSKILLMSFSFVLMLGMASAAFYVVDEEGNREKVAPSQQAQENANSQASFKQTSSVQKQSSQSSGGFVDVTGDTLEGGLDMNGFDLTGLPSPDNPSDAVTQRYLDSQIAGIDTEITLNSSEGGSDSYTVPSISDVLEKGNLIDRRLSFNSGIMLGSKSDASPSGMAFGSSSTALGINSVALGNGASALGRNSIALGNGTQVEENDTVRVGSNTQEMDLVVSGDIHVDGKIEGLNESTSSSESNTSEDENSSSKYKHVWSDTATIGTNGTQVFLPRRFENKSYTVSLTPLGSLASVGVFNKSDLSFEARSSELTEVEIMAVPNP